MSNDAPGAERARAAENFTASAAYRVLGFLALFVALQLLYTALHDSVGIFWIQHFAVAPGAVLIQWLGLPPAVGEADQLVGTMQRLRVRAGCEGTETLFLLLAALAVLPGRLVAKLAGMIIGAGLVVALNSARIAALWATLAAKPQHFETVHSIVAPLLLIGFVYLYVLMWSRWASVQSKVAA